MEKDEVIDFRFTRKLFGRTPKVQMLDKNTSGELRRMFYFNMLNNTQIKKDVTNGEYHRHPTDFAYDPDCVKINKYVNYLDEQLYHVFKYTDLIKEEAKILGEKLGFNEDVKEKRVSKVKVSDIQDSYSITEIKQKIITPKLTRKLVKLSNAVDSLLFIMDSPKSIEHKKFTSLKEFAWGIPKTNSTDYQNYINLYIEKSGLGKVESKIMKLLMLENEVVTKYPKLFLLFKELYDQAVEYKKTIKNKHKVGQDVVPDHYTSSDYEYIRFADDIDISNNLGNVMKYISRWRGKLLERDVEKAWFYAYYHMYGTYTGLPSLANDNYSIQKRQNESNISNISNVEKQAK